jgi:hypothetical protein
MAEPTPPRSSGPWTAARIAEPVRAALEAADLAAFGQLLSPDVQWGPPGSKNPPCKNREQVLTWYSRGRSAGARAQVIELTVEGDRLLVGLAVARDPEHPGVASERWQVLTVGPQGVRDIRGYEERHQASAALTA